MKPWARVFDTAHGQLLLVKSSGGGIELMGAPNGDRQPVAVSPSFEDETKRDEFFEAMSQQDAEDAAAKLFLMVAPGSQVGHA